MNKLIEDAGSLFDWPDAQEILTLKPRQMANYGGFKHWFFLIFPHTAKSSSLNSFVGAFLMHCAMQQQKHRHFYADSGRFV